MQKRPLGRTGEQLSIIGLGGIVLMGMAQEEANTIVAEAVDRGVNYFDNSPAYTGSEVLFGPALQPYREQVFLVSKTPDMSKDGSARDLENSLRLLRTDHFDMYMLHCVSTMEQVEQVFSPDGAMETLLSAQKAGKVRYLGFSAHTEGAALELLRRFPFDAVLFPFNFVCWVNGFGPRVYEATKECGAGRLALKAMARTNWADDAEPNWHKTWYQPIDNPEDASLALRFTLSQDITAAIPPGEAPLFRMALDIAEKYSPITSEEIEKLKEMAGQLQPIFPLG